MMNASLHRIMNSIKSVTGIGHIHEWKMVGNGDNDDECACGAVFDCDTGKVVSPSRVKNILTRSVAPEQPKTDLERVQAERAALGGGFDPYTHEHTWQVIYTDDDECTDRRCGAIRYYPSNCIGYRDGRKFTPSGEEFSPVEAYNYDRSPSQHVTHADQIPANQVW